MYTKTAASKNTKGTLESFQEDWESGLGRWSAEGISLGLADTPENRVKGESVARQMHLDMLAGSFDSSTRCPHTHLAVVEAIKPTEALDLAQLWDMYVAHKEPRLASPITKISC